MRSLLLLALLSAPLSAQLLSFGGKIGTPLNQAFNNDGGKFSYTHTTGRYVFGPTVELRLPFGIGLEADALYRRYNLGGTVNHWEFPILVKYRFPGLLFRPFIDAGPSFNHVSDPGTLLNTRLHATSSGFALGAGAEVKAILIRIAPELRYTHWSNQNINLAPVNSGLSSSQNQIEILVGITF